MCIFRKWIGYEFLRIYVLNEKINFKFIQQNKLFLDELICFVGFYYNLFVVYYLFFFKQSFIASYSIKLSDKFHSIL